MPASHQLIEDAAKVSLAGVLGAGDWHLLRRKDSTSSTGSNGDAMTLLRIGSITLPSSMDLRQYLEQMQEVGDGDDDAGPVATAAAAAPPGTASAPTAAAAQGDAGAILQAPGVLTCKLRYWQCIECALSLK